MNGTADAGPRATLKRTASTGPRSTLKRTAGAGPRPTSELNGSPRGPLCPHSQDVLGPHSLGTLARHSCVASCSLLGSSRAPAPHGSCEPEEIDAVGRPIQLPRP